MGDIHSPEPVLLLVAASSRYESALDWTQQQLETTYGPTALVSQPFAFTETTYYEATMGTNLLKQFLIVQQPIDPVRLPEIKHQTNAWEAQYAEAANHREPRPLNLDPGYLSLGKLVLASTKDHSHRIYLGQGIYAEVTLHYQQGAWQTKRWTYPDYARLDYQDFFSQARKHLLAQRKRNSTT